MGIYDMIQLLKSRSGYNQNMLVAYLYFWDSTHNILCFPSKMLTPSLFNIGVITSLQPTGEAFNPYEMSEDTINFDANKSIFTHYMY